AAAHELIRKLRGLTRISMRAHGSTRDRMNRVARDWVKDVPTRVLRELATRLGAPDVEPHDAELVVTLEGVPVHVLYDLRSAGSTSVQSTTVGVRSKDMPGPRLTWNFDIRRQTLDDAHNIAAGRTRDIVFDDPPFDDMFLVEAAPQDA